MLTPQEVSEHAFSKASFGGYNMGMVDEFLDVLTADYTTLYKENTTLKAKMKVLVEKVEEYRSTEDAMRRALLAAQKMADDMLAEAEEKKTALLRDTEKAARERMEYLRQEIASEELRLRSAQEATISFVTQARDLCKRETEFLSNLAGISAPAPQEDPVNTAAQDIEASVEKLVQEEQAPVASGAVETAPEGGLYAELQEMIAKSAEDEVEEPTEPTRRIDLDHLEFWKDYDIR